MGFEPTIPIFERPKAVRFLDHETVVIGQNPVEKPVVPQLVNKFE
jgi:hypothetical protein